MDGTNAIKAFKAFVRRKAFPCLGAKSALSRDALECFCASNIASAADDQRIVERLQKFADTCKEDDVFVSFAILFPASTMLSELEFERALWERLDAIHKLDRVSYDWDGRVSSDPAANNFSMSVGGKGFFVIGLHPGASRRARRFQCPALIFNLHSQFEHLRADGRYDKLRSAIIMRDIAFSGSSNPMLAVHGERSAARQYSGRAVGDDWVCPFAASKKESRE